MSGCALLVGSRRRVSFLVRLCTAARRGEPGKVIATDQTGLEGEMGVDAHVNFRLVMLDTGQPPCTADLKPKFRDRLPAEANVHLPANGQARATFKALQLESRMLTNPRRAFAMRCDAASQRAKATGLSPGFFVLSRLEDRHCVS